MNEEMRKEFEEWIIKSNITGGFPSSIMKNENGTYIEPQAVYLWLAWQASREAMKPINLPDFDIFNHTDCWFDGESEHVIDDFDADECRKFVISQIKQAGYKVSE